MSQTKDWKPFSIVISGHSTLEPKDVKLLLYDFLGKLDEFPQFAIMDEHLTE